MSKPIPDIRVRNDLGCSVAHLMAERGWDLLGKVLSLCEGSWGHPEWSDELLRGLTKDGRTVLHCAAKGGCERLVAFLAEGGVLDFWDPEVERTAQCRLPLTRVCTPAIFASEEVLPPFRLQQAYGFRYWDCAPKFLKIGIPLRIWIGDWFGLLKHQ